MTIASYCMFPRRALLRRVIARWATKTVAALLVGITQIGCDKADAPKPQKTLLPPVLGSGSIKGHVRLVGEPPGMKEILNDICHKGAGPLTEESVVVNPDGTLRNVFVYVTGATASSGEANAEALLDQINCQYVPHVIGVQVGQTLRIKSSDPTMHNVRFAPKHAEAFNLSMTDAGQSSAVTFSSPEFIRVKCDVHPWMTAYIGVFDSPFFQATGDGGAFEIARLPVGKYTLHAWHETYGTLDREVDIVDDTPVTIDFEYRGPQ